MKPDFLRIPQPNKRSQQSEYKSRFTNLAVIYKIRHLRDLQNYKTIPLNILTFGKMVAVICYLFHLRGLILLF